MQTTVISAQMREGRGSGSGVGVARHVGMWRARRSQLVSAIGFQGHSWRHPVCENSVQNRYRAGSEEGAKSEKDKEHNGSESSELRAESSGLRAQSSELGRPFRK